MIYDAIVSLCGTVPAGLEDFVYIASLAILVFLILSAFTLIGSVFKRLSDG